MVQQTKFSFGFTPRSLQFREYKVIRIFSAVCLWSSKQLFSAEWKVYCSSIYRFPPLTIFFSFSISDLRKEFEVPPYSQNVELGSQIELRCHPPVGVPKPRVSQTLFCHFDAFRNLQSTDFNIVFQLFKVEHSALQPTEWKRLPV